MDYQDPDWVADRLGIDRNTVYRFLQDGTLPALQLGRKWLVSERRLEEWLASETDKQTRARREAARPAADASRRLDNFTAGARGVLKRAHAEARRYAHEQLTGAHVLLALTEDPSSDAAGVLRSLGVTPQRVRDAIESSLTPGDAPAARRLPRAPDAKRAMRLASRLAQREAGEGGSPLSPVGTDHLLQGIFLSRRGIGHDLMVRHDVTRQRLRSALRDAKTRLNRNTKGDSHDA